MSIAPGSERDPTEVSNFVERLAGLLSEIGMSLMPSRVFSALIADDSGRLTAAELSERLQVSPAAISGAVRYLTSLNLIGRERERGSRRDHYFIKDQFWYEAMIRREQVLGRIVVQLRDGLDALGPETPAGRRITESVAFYEFLIAEYPRVLERWRTYQDEQSSLRNGA